jgi:hypothetical protein
MYDTYEKMYKMINYNRKIFGMLLDSSTLLSIYDKCNMELHTSLDT